MAMTTEKRLKERITEIDLELQKITTPSSIIQWLITEKQVLSDVVEGKI